MFNLSLAHIRSINKSVPLFSQIKARVQTKGKRSILLSPIVKEQNRMNMAAFTERELSFLTADPQNMQYLSNIDTMREGVGWMPLGQIMFMNIVQETADQFDIKMEDVVQNVTKMPVNCGILDRDC